MQTQAADYSSEKIWNIASDLLDSEIPVDSKTFVDELSLENLGGFQTFLQDYFEISDDPKHKITTSSKILNSSSGTVADALNFPQPITPLSDNSMKFLEIPYFQSIHPTVFPPPQSVLSVAGQNGLLQTIASRGGIDEYSNDQFAQLLVEQKEYSAKSKSFKKKIKTSTSTVNQEKSQDEEKIEDTNEETFLSEGNNSSQSTKSVKELQDLIINQWELFQNFLPSEHSSANQNDRKIIKHRKPKNQIQAQQHNFFSKEVYYNPIKQVKYKTLLGQRGRFCMDVINEEDFFDKEFQTESDVKQPVVLTDFSHLFRFYDDDHDGVCIDWLREALEFQLSSTASARKKQRLQSIYDDPAYRICDDGPITIIPPPPPVHLQHPASWGLNSRNSHNHLTLAPPTLVTSTATSHNKAKGRPARKASDAFRIDVTKVHPACVSGAIVDSPSAITAEILSQTLQPQPIETHPITSPAKTHNGSNNNKTNKVNNKTSNNDTSNNIRNKYDSNNEERNNKNSSNNMNKSNHKQKHGLVGSDADYESSSQTRKHPHSLYVLESWDEISVAALETLHALKLQETLNFILLRRLQHKCELAASPALKSLRETRKRLMAALDRTSEFLSTDCSAHKNVYGTLQKQQQQRQQQRQQEQQQQEQQQQQQQEQDGEMGIQDADGVPDVSDKLDRSACPDIDVDVKDIEVEGDVVDVEGDGKVDDIVAMESIEQEQGTIGEGAEVGMEDEEDQHLGTVPCLTSSGEVDSSVVRNAEEGEGKGRQEPSWPASLLGAIGRCDALPLGTFALNLKRGDRLEFYNTGNIVNALEKPTAVPEVSLASGKAGRKRGKRRRKDSSKVDDSTGVPPTVGAEESGWCEGVVMDLFEDVIEGNNPNNPLQRITQRALRFVKVRPVGHNVGIWMAVEDFFLRPVDYDVDVDIDGESDSDMEIITSD